MGPVQEHNEGIIVVSHLRVLWLSSSSLFEQDTAGTGTWLSPFGKKLVDTEQVSIGNVMQGNTKAPSHKSAAGIQQWIVPRVDQASYRNGHLSERFSTQILEIVDSFSPDLIHVWGTESIWGLVTARKLVALPALLEMQGIKQAIARVYAGGLSFKEQLASIGLKELLRRRTMFHDRKRFEEWGRFEREIIGGHMYIVVQSTWLEAQVRAINNQCQVFHRDFILRDPFYKAALWQPSRGKSIFCSASYPSAFKGLHVIVRALAILKESFPDIQLRIAGSLQKSKIRQDGYIAWLNKEAQKLGVSSQIVWLDGIRATQIVQEMLGASCMVLPTYIEGYSLVTAEAASIGMPIVAAYAGGIPSYAKDRESALFFSPGDVEMCAYQLARVLCDPQLAEQLSGQAHKTALIRNNPENIVQRQLEIYNHVATGKNVFS